MTADRELLERAARAAGYLIGITDDGVMHWCRERGDGLPVAERVWNPLTDDGDALRLAVRLNIPVYPYDDETSTGTAGVVAKNWGDKESNTRRAIVRAAAEMAP